MSAQPSLYLPEDLERLAALVTFIGEFQDTLDELSLWQGVTADDGISRRSLISSQYRLIDWLDYYRRSQAIATRVNDPATPEETWAQVLLKLALTIEQLETLNMVHQRECLAAVSHPLMLGDLCDVLRSLYAHFKTNRPRTASQLSQLEIFGKVMTSLLHHLEHIS